MMAHPCLILLKLIDLPDLVASNISPFTAATWGQQITPRDLS